MIMLKKLWTIILIIGTIFFTGCVSEPARYFANTTITPKHINGCIGEFDEKPYLKSGKRPKYPIGRMFKGIQGSTKLEFIVLSEGAIGDVKVLETSDEWFGVHAKMAIEAWKVLPAKLGGKPQQVSCVLYFDYKL